ncbi:hypothetical protein NL108_018074 [Boleophthalmus pectinirostris]|nr:hypothetical protein NL108_018074 [Boleophthalmus pectinirostris]
MDPVSTDRPPSPAPSSVSLKSDRSKDEPPDFSEPRPPSPSALSSVSVKSDWSRGLPPVFSEPRPNEFSNSSSVSSTNDASDWDNPRPHETTTSSSVSRSSEADPSSEDHSSSEGEEEETLFDEMGFPKLTPDSTKQLKIQNTKTTEKYEKGVKEKLDSAIYDMKTNNIKKIDALFKLERTVLTVGVAGIGKTFQAKKYVKDKKKSKGKQLKIFLDLEKLNSKQMQSLTDLLSDCFEGSNQSFNYSSEEMTIILDGLDKCTLPLDFENNKTLKDITQSAPVDELLTNLLQGNLLPSAQLWILTRPSGQNKIPEKYIHSVTECGETVERHKRLASKLKERFKKEKEIQDTKKTELFYKSRDANPVKISSLSDLFKSEKEERVRTVLTEAEKGLDRSFHVQELIKNWAKAESILGRAASGFSSWFGRKDKEKAVLLFPLMSSKLLLQKELSFVELLNQFFKETEQCVMSDYKNLSCVFIVDGLEEFKVDWTVEDRVRDVYESAPVTVLLSSLIRGDLFPSALVWITSTPDAAQPVPPELLHRTTHIRDKNALDELSKKLKDKIKQRVKRQEMETELYEIKSDKQEKVLLSEILTRSKVRTVLTTGVPRIGKTFYSEMFQLDWAEGKFKTDFVISIPFDELNPSSHKSLKDLLNQYLDCKVSKGCYYDEYKILLILDGLDKCTLPLDFENNQELKDITQSAPVDELLTNLLQGNLLPSAQLWILTRPSGQNKIPEQHIHSVTECRESEKRRQKLKTKLKTIFEKKFVFEENPSHPNQKNTEHIRPDRVDRNGRKQQITVSSLFEKEAGKPVRTVLTIGEAEIGKSYLVRKVLHDWVTSDCRRPFSANKQTTVFPLTYSLVNTLTQTLSFVELLNKVFKETEQCVMSDYNKLSCVFILDGLEEFKVDWTVEDRVTDVYESAPVTVLLSSLIRGDLLPSALVWITSRPDAAQPVPPELLHRTTHIREKPDIVSQRNLKRTLIKQYEWVSEGVDRCKTTGVSLRDVYTNLYIIEEERDEVCQQVRANWSNGERTLN